MKLLTIVIIVLVCAASVAAWIHLFDYLPFVGRVHYFCSRSGVEYLVLMETESVALHVANDGSPVRCQ